MNQEIAFRSFIDKLRLTDPNSTIVRDYNKGRHKIISYKGENLYCIFKRDFFGAFQKYYPSFADKFPDEKKAESINVVSLSMAMQYSRIVFLHSGETYFTYPLQVRKFCEAYNLIRTQQKENTYKSLGGDKEVVNERVYNIPMMLLTEWTE